jgi:hypothetical protein
MLEGVMKEDRTEVKEQPSPVETEPSILHLQTSIREGNHWYVALLEAIALWKKAEENFRGRAYRYLIAREAFDWLILAERLCDEIAELIPPKEKDALLFRGQPPINVSPEKFKELIGLAKYHHYLNYFYGITAEEALVLAAEEEVRKQKWSWGYCREPDVTNEAYRRIYGASFREMLNGFRQENSIPESDGASLTELKEFAYWRFKFRIKVCEKAKVASDSRKAITWLNEHGVSRYVQRLDVPEYFEEAVPEGEQA